METKKPWQSKTLLAQLIMSVAAFFPPVQAIISAHPELIVLVFAGINTFLRIKTQGKITLND